MTAADDFPTSLLSVGVLVTFALWTDEGRGVGVSPREVEESVTGVLSR